METLRQISSVLLVFGLLGGALWALRRNGSAMWRRPQCGGKPLRSLQRLALTPQHSLHLVHVNGRELIVATHPQGCTVVSEMSKGSAA